MQNAESDADRGDHNKSEEGVITLVIACLGTAKFLEAIKETFYHIPPLIRLFNQTATAALCSLSAGSYSGRTGRADKFGSLLCHRLYRQESARISQSFRSGSSFSRETASVQSSTFPADSKKATGRMSFPAMAWIFVFRSPRVLPMLFDV